MPSSPHYRLSSEDEDDDTDVAVGGRVLSDEMDDSDGTFMDEVPSEDEQEEEGASAPIAYIGVAKPIKSLRRAIEDIKAEVIRLILEQTQPAADEEQLREALWAMTVKALKQRAAVMKALHARDYSLILGFPGTGKSSTIVAA